MYKVILIDGTTLKFSNRQKAWYAHWDNKGSTLLDRKGRKI